MPDPEQQDPAATAAATPSPSGGGTVLATHLPHHLVVGDHTITPEGTEVPAGEVDSVIAAGAANGVTVFEIGGDS